MPKKKDPRIEKAKEKAQLRKQAGIMAKEAGDLRARATRAEKTERERVSGARSKAEDARIGNKTKTPSGAGTSLAASLNAKADELESELRKLKRRL